MAKDTIPKLKIDFEKLIAKGENAKGFTSQTANGTARWRGTGWNRDEAFSMPEIAPRGPWRGGR